MTGSAKQSSRGQAKIRIAFVAALLAMTAVLFSNWHSAGKKPGS
jgi:hypothetical protein